MSSSTPQDWSRQLPWDHLPHTAAQVIERAVAIQQVSAPTFDEAPRAELVRQAFVELGLEAVGVDALHNVYGLLPGQQRSGVLVSAHTDTVFPAETVLTLRREAGLIYGPGIGDNSLGVAAMIELARLLRTLDLRRQDDVWFVANTREEGLGDLGGMKAVMERLRGQVSRVINLEGMAFGHVYHSGIAVRRLLISAQTSGGHSWLDFGRPSAVHILLKLGAKITAISPPAVPRTTYNIGVIQGGQSINTLAAQASFWLDLRSENPTALAHLEGQVRALLAAAAAPDVRLGVEVVGDRPAGAIPADHPLVQMALAALDEVGINGTLETGSTDANIPLAGGIPAVTIGVSRGGNAHRLDEYIETQPVANGMKQLLLLVLSACGAQAS